MDKIIFLFSRVGDPELWINCSQYLLIFVIFYSFLEVVFPPIPGQTLLLFSGSLAGVTGMNPMWVIAVASAGTFLASLFLFNLGAKTGRHILDSSKFSWILDSRTFLKLEQWFHHYGLWTLLVSRFLPLARSGLVLTAGIVNLDPKGALAAIGASTVLSSSVFILSGYWLGEQWKKVPQLYRMGLGWVLLTASIIMILFLIFLLIRKTVKQAKPAGD
jgi:membrane protein DedA with SNARE-associated domain